MQIGVGRDRVYALNGYISIIFIIVYNRQLYNDILYSYLINMFYNDNIIVYYLYLLNKIITTHR